MANPYLPSWEYIPDGEPRVFKDRVYIYGSHDRVGSNVFCDYQLKVWSAPVDDLMNWTCHGVSFATRDVNGHESDVDWTTNELYAPDVVEKDGRYYLYAYILGEPGCVAVSDRPEGPFTLLSKYQYQAKERYNDGQFIDPGVLVDDDGRVYIYCGFLRSYMAEIDGRDMVTVLDDTYQPDIIPEGEAETDFFEACSPRKVGDTYYLIYSPKKGSRLDYRTSDSPTGPFVHRGTIIDNELDYPGGNDHGSICQIGDQWYIFYHRMSNGTCMSRRGCVERIEILPDGSIPQVEMTSLGFAESLNPFEFTQADTACVLIGGCQITERDPFSRAIVGITNQCIMGWKYYDFGEDNGSDLEILIKVRGQGCNGRIHVLADAKDGEELGVLDFGTGDGVLTGKLKPLSGRHAIFLRVDDGGQEGWIASFYEGRNLIEIEGLVFRR